MTSISCVFCRIIRRELPASIVYEDDTVLAIMDINPINQGHVLVMPKHCCQSLQELPDTTAQQVFAVVKKVEAALWQAGDIACEGTNILQNNGRSAWQDVFHVHFHVIPRFAGDGFKIKYQAGRPTRTELDQMAAALSFLLP